MHISKRLGAALLTVVGAGALWYALDTSRPNASGMPDVPSTSTPGMPGATTAIPETTSDPPSEPPRRPQAPPSLATGASSASTAPPASNGDGAAPAASSPTNVRQRAIDELMREMAATAYREQGSRYVAYLVASGLAPADAERLVERGFRDAAECSFDAMRAEAEAESVPFDTVLYALEAMFYNGDGPLLRGVIDMEAVNVRGMPCMFAVLQEVGIPAHVLQEIQQAPVAAEE